MCIDKRLLDLRPGTAHRFVLIANRVIRFINFFLPPSKRDTATKFINRSGVILHSVVRSKDQSRLNKQTNEQSIQTSRIFLPREIEGSPATRHAHPNKE